MLVVSIITFILLTYIERRIYLYFRSEIISEWHSGKRHVKNLKIPVYGFFYRIYVDFND